MKLQAVLFDMGGTIETYWFDRDFRIRNVHSIRHCLAGADIGLCLTDEQLADVITRGVKAYHRMKMDSMVESPAVKVWSEFILNDFKVPEEALAPIAEELAFLYETRLYQRVMRPEIPEVLEQIRRMGLKIGCISNTQSLGQVPYNLQKYGIAEYFDPVVLSSAYGRRKPDPSIFHHASRLAQAPAGACAYVGDKITRDILGARRAGYALAVQIRHSFDEGEEDTGCTPDAVIEDMRDLLPILDETLQKEIFPAAAADAPVKAVFFDAGDILYHRPQSGMRLRAFARRHGLQTPSNLAAEVSRLKNLAFQDKMRRHEYYSAILRLYGVSDPQQMAEGMAAIEEDDLTVEIIPEVPETILQLREHGYMLGIITDTALPVSIKLSWFEKHGFGHVWDTFISSREIGIRKPAPEIYHKAFEQLGIRPEEAVFVGHKTSELDGAHAVGMKTVAFNYDKEAVADVYIDRFSDLLHVSFLERARQA